MMNMGLDFAPLVPIWFCVLFLISLILMFLLTFALKRNFSILRFICGALLFLIMLNPVITGEKRNYLPDIAVLVIDNSKSQLFGKRQKQIETARMSIIGQLNKIRNLEVREFKFSQKSNINHEGTRLFTKISSLIRDLPQSRIAGVIVITDGQIHDIPGKLNITANSAPIHALITGSNDEYDRRLVVEQAPKFGIIGSKRIIKIRVEDTGNYEDHNAILEATINGKKVFYTKVPVNKTIEFPINIEHSGKIITEISTSPIPGELTVKNNSTIITTMGVRDRLKVLLVSGEPHSGERTWRDLLKSDAAIDLIHFTILRPPEKRDSTPQNELSLIPFPTTELFEEKLSGFDLIIFDRYRTRNVLGDRYFSNIVEYVKNGGAVLVSSGPEINGNSSIYDTPLSSILPTMPELQIIEMPYKAKITKYGNRHPVTRGIISNSGKQNNLGQWFRFIKAKQKSGKALLSGIGDSPLLLLDEVNKGRVAQILSDHIWLWSRKYDGGGPYNKLLRNLSHWLMHEPELEEERLFGEYDGKNIVIRRQTVADTVNKIDLYYPDSKKEQISLSKIQEGMWEAKLPVKDSGIYRIHDKLLSATIAVGNTEDKENQEVISTADKIKDTINYNNGEISFLDNRTLDSQPRNIIEDETIKVNNSNIGLKRNKVHIVEKVISYNSTFNIFILIVILLIFPLTWYLEVQKKA